MGVRDNLHPVRIILVFIDHISIIIYLCSIWLYILQYNSTIFLIGLLISFEIHMQFYGITLLNCNHMTLIRSENKSLKSYFMNMVPTPKNIFIPHCITLMFGVVDVLSTGKYILLYAELVPTWIFDRASIALRNDAGYRL